MDPNSFANVQDVVVESFDLNLDVNFRSKTLSGYIDMKTKALRDAKQIVMDTKDLSISKIVDGKGAALGYELSDADAVFGAKLTVQMPGGESKAGESASIRIYYSTSPKSSAIQWLPPSNTAGKKHPYLFTQCQAIHARAMFPCQDSPGVKSTYKATVRVPAPLVALMSAQRVTTGSSGSKSTDSEVSEFKFTQPVPTPSYLVALVVGALEERKIGPRSSVWSEAEMVDAGAAEFADTEQYLKTAESIVGPYVWGRYDILLLPPSFPYGGMENPCLTFVTPTLLAGDKSLATVVVHEISHSWMGNLVTCKTWVDFWMNEGFCRFLELKILKALMGAKFFDLFACIGLKALRESVARYGTKHNYTKMRPNLDGVDPDDAFSSVPYEKGMNFLIYLEGVVGGDTKMNPFLRAYCEKFKFKAVTAEAFRDFFMSYFASKGVDKTKLNSIEWDQWWNTTGMPYKANTFDTSLADASVAAANGIMKGIIPDAKRVAGWSTQQSVVFLDTLEDLEVAFLEAKKGGDGVARKDMRERLEPLAKACPSISQSKNSEIRFRWCKVCIRADREAVFPDAIKFITEQGRMKFVRPLYRLLFASGPGRQRALETFAKAKGMYHPVAAKMLEKDLGLVTVSN